MSNSQESLQPSRPDGVHPEMRYDDAGNAFVCDANGIWVPHRGFALPLPNPSRQSGGPVHALAAHSDVGRWPGDPSARFVEHRSVGPNPWTLSTPASFSHAADHGFTQPSISYPARNPRDPASVPLPQGRDDDLIVPHVIAESQGYIRSPKIAGSRHSVKGKSEKAKGKEKEKVGVEKSKKYAHAIELDDQEDSTAKKSKKRSRILELDDDDDVPKAKRGRPQGANNYSVKDTNMLLDLVEDELPLGQRGWTVVTTRYNKWATQSGRPVRKQTSLETKFKQLVKTTKPTGTGVCPPEVKRAHTIDELINERAGTRELADSDFDDIQGGNNDLSSSDDDVPHPEPRVAVARSARTEAPAPRRTRGAAATDLLTSLSHAFDPAVQQARDADRASRSLANTQLLTVSQQLRDSQATNDKLRGQIFDLRNRLYEAQRATDRAEMRLEMAAARHNPIPGPSRQAPPRFQEPKKKNQYYRWFADGGEALAWLSEDDPTNWEVDDQLVNGDYSGKDLEGSNTGVTDDNSKKPSEDVSEL